jgi:RNA polymerase primary sigma factor
MQSDDSYQSYIDSIKRIPLLSAEKEMELARRASKGDKEAARQLIEANLRLVIKIGQKYISSGFPLMDLIQEGNVGLMSAVEKFDLSKKVRFANYAIFWIRHTIVRFIANRRHAIKLPVKKEDLLRKIYVTEHLLHQKFGRPPKIDEIAAEIGCSVYDIDSVKNIASNPLSIEAGNGASKGDPLVSLCDNNHRYDPEHEFLLRYSRKETRRFLKAHLNVRERNVILYRFRFIDSEAYTFKKIGDTMGITAEAVRQIEKRALDKIRTKRDELLNCVYA